MAPISKLILPPKDLANCIAACILRDTRGTNLSDTDRLNFFPASPLYTITLTQQGQLHVGDRICGVDDLKDVPPAPMWLFEAPKTTPFASWSPGPLFAATIAFFPDAWFRLGGKVDGTPPPAIKPALDRLSVGILAGDWSQFWQETTSVWMQTAGTGWAGSHLLKDWIMHLALRSAQTSAGKSVRTAQRRFLALTGQSQASIAMFAKAEELHRIVVSKGLDAPADIALEAGFADQSHMGRSLKRVTGFSPVFLNQRIAEDEAFWCYRLLGERF